MKNQESRHRGGMRAMVNDVLPENSWSDILSDVVCCWVLLGVVVCSVQGIETQSERCKAPKKNRE